MVAAPAAPVKKLESLKSEGPRREVAPEVKVEGASLTAEERRKREEQERCAFIRRGLCPLAGGGAGGSRKPDDDDTVREVKSDWGPINKVHVPRKVPGDERHCPRTK